MGDYELEKKVQQKDMSVEAITEAIPEYMYEKINDSPETEAEKIRHVEKKRIKYTLEQTDCNPESR